MTVKEINKYKQEEQHKIKTIEEKFDVEYFMFEKETNSYCFSKQRIGTFLKLSPEWLNELTK